MDTHKELVSNTGKCSVELVVAGVSKGFCNEEAFGFHLLPLEFAVCRGRYRDANYVGTLACPMHGGPCGVQAEKEVGK